MTTSNLLAITELAETQDDRYELVNEAFGKLEMAGHYPVKDVNLNTPPGSPAEGDVYVIGTAGTGAWSGHNNELTQYYNGAWIFLPPRVGMLALAADDRTLYDYRTTEKWSAFAAATGGTAPTESFVIACSDETTALTAGTGKVTWRTPYALTVTAVKASLTTAQTSGSIFTVDINESASSILSTKLTVDNGEKTSATAATAAVISDSALAADAEITIDIDQIGDGTAKGLKVVIIGHQ